MEQLIKITEQDGKQVVSGRELHQFLESKQDFSHWITHRIDYCDLTEGEDFTIVLTQNGRGRPSSDYAFTIDAADEISMVEKNNKGKVARKYFINFRNKVRDAVITLGLPQDFEDALESLLKEVRITKQLKQENTEKDLIITEMQPNAELGKALKASKDSILIKEAAHKVSNKQEHFHIRMYDFYDLLVHKGWIYKNRDNKYNAHSEPLKNGWLQEETNNYEVNGYPHIGKTVKVTVEGLEHLLKHAQKWVMDIPTLRDKCFKSSHLESLTNFDCDSEMF
jgi:anti-repressor protein